MNNIHEYRTTLHHVKAGMQVIYHGEIMKIIRLKEKKLTNKGLIYQFDTDGWNGTLKGNGGNKITVLEKIDDLHKNKSWYVYVIIMKCVHCNRKLEEYEIMQYSCNECEQYFLDKEFGSKFQLIISTSKFYFRKIINIV